MPALKTVYLLLGWLFFSIGLIGAFLPVLPTTPFMLLALWLFARSSDRFHRWLYTHRVFGPPLQQWHVYRVIPWQAKLASISMMLLSFAYMLLYAVMSWWLNVIVGVVMLYGAWFILSKPSSAPAGVIQQTATE